VFATNVSDALARLDGFQDGDDLRLAEFALSHWGLLASYSPGNLYFSMARFLGRVTPRFHARFAAITCLALQNFQVNRLQNFFGLRVVAPATVQRPAEAGFM
jgi:hypothetical protein